ncbi:MAG TPA: hypothetical protein VMW73_17825 [Spirochaetia bacterium]|nr:hypothetical protein [Spirochaetia bacterium]
MYTKRAIIILATIILASATLSAEPVKGGLYYDQNIQASYNPLGLQFVSKLFYRAPLVKSGGILWDSTKIDFGLQNNLSPGYDLIGAFVNVEPIALFSLNATAQLAGFYKTLGYGFYSLASYSSGFDSASLQALTPQNATGYVLSVAPTLKAAVGPISVLDTGTLTYYNVDNGQGFFYERIGNVVLGKSDSELANSAYLLCSVMQGLYVGVNDSLTYVPSSAYLSHRLNAIAAYSGPSTGGLSFYGAFMAGTFLADRYYQYALYIAGQFGVTMKL